MFYDKQLTVRGNYVNIKPEKVGNEMLRLFREIQRVSVRTKSVTNRVFANYVACLIASLWKAVKEGPLVLSLRREPFCKRPKKIETDNKAATLLRETCMQVSPGFYSLQDGCIIAVLNTLAINFFNPYPGIYLIQFYRTRKEHNLVAVFQHVPAGPVERQTAGVCELTKARVYQLSIACEQNVYYPALVNRSLDFFFFSG